MARTTIEEAEKICEDAGLQLLEYPGQVQRIKSTVKCKACGEIWSVILGTVKSGRSKCPKCRKSTPIEKKTVPVEKFTPEEITVLKAIVKEYIAKTTSGETTVKNSIFRLNIAEEYEQKEREEASRRAEIDARIDAKYKDAIKKAEQDVAYWQNQVKTS
jgi:hypothetical protein